MKIHIRLMAMLVSLAVSGPAISGWVQYATVEGFTWFYEEPFLRREGQLRSFWIVKSLAAPDDKGASSYRYLVQFDCAKSRYRYLSERATKDPMGEGKILSFDDTFTAWTEASPSGLMGHLKTHACRPT